MAAGRARVDSGYESEMSVGGTVATKKKKALGMPLWRQMLLLACIIAVTGCVIYIGNNHLKDAHGRPAYIIAHVPFFFLLMLLEGIIGRGAFTTGGKWELADAISSIAAGSFQQIVQRVIDRPLVVALGALPYQWLYNNYGVKYGPDLVGDETSLLAWFGTFVGIDFFYYWFHRAGHEINFIWAAHAVHHSSEHYNMSTALRQSYFQGWFNWFFYLPLALVFPVPVYLALAQWNTLYQFWIHTTCIRRLGPLEYILNTPSHHRVHHDRRVHRNYGATLIIWDRIFGTFMDEHDNAASGEERVMYGVMQGVWSWNPFTVQFKHYGELFTKIGRAPTLTGKLRSWFVGPGYRPMLHRSEPPPIVNGVARIRFTTDLSSTARVYMFCQFAITMVALGVSLGVGKHLNYMQNLVFLGSILVCLWTGGLVLDGSKHGRALEQLRCVAMGIGLLYLLRDATSMVRLMEIGAATQFISAAVVTFCPEATEATTRVIKPKRD